MLIPTVSTTYVATIILCNNDVLLCKLMNFFKTEDLPHSENYHYTSITV